jgi:hypothetical protein
LLCQIIEEDNFNFTVRREHKNIDIEILGDNGNNYIIENKVKDILQQKQYNEITELFIRDKYKKVFLFSLLGNNLSMLDIKNEWTEIGYKKIIDCLLKYKYKDNYLTMIIKDYCNFIENLIKLLNIELCDRYVFHNENELHKKLNEIRIFGLYLKYSMSSFMSYFKKYNKDILTDYTINRGMGTMSFYRLIDSYNKIGIQIENLQYRKYSVCDIKTRNKLEKLGWFDKNYRSTRNKQYLEYTDKDINKKFYYQLQDKNIKDIEFKDLYKMINKDLFSI